MAASLGVLVTRPAGQAEALCAALERAGYSAHSLPLLQLQPLPELAPDQRELVSSLDKFQHIIFVSGNAVRWGMPWIEAVWPQLPVGPNWYAVGDATARLLSSHGVSASTPGDVMTSEGLLELPGLRQVRGHRALIIKGEGGRQTLAAELIRRGSRVDELACYRRGAPVLEPGELAQKLAQWNIGLVMISSGEGITNMLALLGTAEATKFIDTTLLVPSQRVAQLAHSAGFSRVVTAENASDSAMLSALAAWQPTAGE